MQKHLAWVLIVVIGLGLSDRMAYASNDRSNKQLSTPDSNSITEHDEMKADWTAADFKVAQPEPTSVSLSEAKSIENQNGPTSPAGQQTSSRHGGHFLRNALIGVGVVLVLVVVIAVAAKK